MSEFDHLALSAQSLEEGVEAIEAVLGVAMQPGGVHPHMGTHNRLLGLGPGAYLEVIAIDPDAPEPPHPRWFRLDRFSGPPRLTNWIVRVADLIAALEAAPAGAGRSTDLARGDYRWRMAVPEDGCLPFDDAYPALIEWRGEFHPAARLPESGCRLARLEVAHPEAAMLDAALSLHDPRIRVVPGEKALRAVIATPHGERVLE